MRWIYVNGELVERDSAGVPALDRAVLHGYGLFETMRSYGGRVFRLHDHFQRLARGARVLDIDLPISHEELEQAIAAVLGRNGLTDARVRLTVTAGAAEGGRPAVVLFARELADYPRELYERGMAAVVSDVRRNETSPLCAIKSLSHLDNVLARQQARRLGADEALLLNTRGLVAEGSASNVFIVREGRLVTPGLDSGALPGVARQTVMELAAAEGIEVVETDIPLLAFEAVAEAFLTGSVMEVMPLTRLDEKPVGGGAPGPTTLRFAQLYREDALAEASRSSAG